jgi:hypothetical protein
MQCDVSNYDILGLSIAPRYISVKQKEIENRRELMLDRY